MARSPRRDQKPEGIRLLQRTTTGRVLELHAHYETPCFYWMRSTKLAKRSKHYELTRI